MNAMTVSDPPNPEQGKQSFEVAIQTLENIVLGLEDGDVELNDLVKKYKEGVELLKYCRAKVESAELTLKELNDSKLIFPDETLDDK